MDILTQQAELERQYKEATDALAAVAGVGSEPLGLTPEAIKATPEYRWAKSEVNAAFRALRRFNAFYMPQIKAARRRFEMLGK